MVVILLLLLLTDVASTLLHLSFDVRSLTTIAAENVSFRMRRICAKNIYIYQKRHTNRNHLFGVERRTVKTYICHKIEVYIDSFSSKSMTTFKFFLANFLFPRWQSLTFRILFVFDVFFFCSLLVGSTHRNKTSRVSI